MHALVVWCIASGTTSYQWVRRDKGCVAQPWLGDGEDHVVTASDGAMKTMGAEVAVSIGVVKAERQEGGVISDWDQPYHREALNTWDIGITNNTAELVAATRALAMTRPSCHTHNVTDKVHGSDAVNRPTFFLLLLPRGPASASAS